MDDPPFGILLLLFGPAIIGVVFLVAALLFLQPRQGQQQTSRRLLLSFTLLLVPFGIGTCYSLLGNLADLVWPTVAVVVLFVIVATAYAQGFRQLQRKTRRPPRDVNRG